MSLKKWGIWGLIIGIILSLIGTLGIFTCGFNLVEGSVVKHNTSCSILLPFYLPLALSELIIISIFARIDIGNDFLFIILMFIIPIVLMSTFFFIISIILGWIVGKFKG